MENEHEHKPLYRFFNVVLFILYFIAVLTTLLAGYIGYSDRKLVGATLKCKDGTTWDATKLYDNSYALCGLCTKRIQGEDKFNHCTYDDMDYSYEVINKKYNFSWNTIIYPIIVFAITFGIIDFLRLAILYIFSGRVAFEKSLLLRTVLLFFSGNDK